MGEQKYWLGLEDHNKDPKVDKLRENEFSEELPILEVLNETVGSQPTRRRDFLKYMGFSVSAAVLAASCEIPVRRAIPYVFKPEEVYPGVSNYYASTYAENGEYCSILVKTREGRPIKIEGNTLSKITRGGTSARVQASVLSLYDNNRLKGPRKNDTEMSWMDMDKEVISRLRGLQNSGKKVVILSSTIMSPSTLRVIEDFKRKYTNTDHVMYDAYSASAILDANEQSFGQRALPSYSFDKAKVIVSFEADFLGTWLSPVEFAKQYVVNRKLIGKNAEMSRHIQFESNMTMTGANADTRVPLKPSLLAQALIQLRNEIASGTGGSVSGGITDSPASDKIKATAKELLQNRGRSLVVCGINDIELQLIVNSINNMLNNYGSTLDINNPAYYKKGSDKAVVELMRAMNSGTVGAVITYNCNPVYDLPFVDEFTKALDKVDVRISLNSANNETVEAMDYICPDHHYLESWNDIQPKAGSYSLVQPTIRNIFNTRQAQDSLLIWLSDQIDPANYFVQEQNPVLDTLKLSAVVPADSLMAVEPPLGAVDTTNMTATTASDLRSTELPLVTTSSEEYLSPYYFYIQNTWKQNIFNRQNKFSNFQTFWDKAVHDGVVEVDGQQDQTSSTTFVTDIQPVAIGATDRYRPGEGFQLVAYEKVGIGNGTHSDNPWLQEMPDPVTKATWDNYVLISVADANALNVDLGDKVRVTANGNSVVLPVVVQPGQSNGTLGIAVGYGRTVSGKAGREVGVNIYPLLAYKDNNRLNIVTEASIEKIGGVHAVAQTQIHHVINSEAKLDQRTIIKEGILPEVEQVKERIQEQREAFHHLNVQSLYPGHRDEYARGHHWKMSIDLNSCIGCGACTIACHAENNVPVVGKDEVIRVHEMHWLRIDRYYTGEDMENPDVVFQPMLCQHCDNAPCENVCPVAATTHSSEGINQMAYNRCIGTRYCANNCPYKVRRFNWYDYLGADSFPVNEHDPFDMQNDLTRMVLNPDVVVRARGVMEKCSFCIQRIQEGKVNAKREGRRLHDLEVKTACMQACPTDAIVFGDDNMKDSLVGQLLNDHRTFFVIEEINTAPSIGYLAKIRNRSREEEVERRKPRTV